MFAFLQCLLNICRKFEFLISKGSVATCLSCGVYCCMGFVANFIRFLAVQKVWKLVNIWQSCREFKGGNFFETQCRFPGRHCPCYYSQFRSSMEDHISANSVKQRVIMDPRRTKSSILEKIQRPYGTSYEWLIVTVVISCIYLPLQFFPTELSWRPTLECFLLSLWILECDLPYRKLESLGYLLVKTARSYFPSSRHRVSMQGTYSCYGAQCIVLGLFIPILFAPSVTVLSLLSAQTLPTQKSNNADYARQFLLPRH